MKILVLGSSGYIGSNFSNFLTLNNHEVVNFDIRLGSLYDLRIEKNEKLELTLSDVDFIFFFAFEIGNSEFIRANDLEFNFLNNNIKLMLNTFSSIKKFKIPFVFVSSSMANNCEISYGVLKKIGERLTKSLGGVNCRIWNVFGGINQESSSHVMQEFKNCAEQGQILMKTDGEEMRQFIFMEDLCIMLYKVMMDIGFYKHKEFVDLTSHYWIKIKDLAKIFSKIYNVNITPSDNKAFLNIHPQPTEDFISIKYSFDILINKINIWLKLH